MNSSLLFEQVDSLPLSHLGNQPAVDRYTDLLFKMPTAYLIKEGRREGKREGEGKTKNY